MIRHLISHKIARISRSVVTIIFATAWIASAQEYLSVSSTTDGNGLFSYSFDLGSSSYVWGVSSDNGDIYIPSFGVLDVICPAGWTASVDAFQGITLAPTSGTVYLGQPSVTFSVLSSSTGTALYDQPLGSGGYQKGAVFGSLYTLPDFQGVAGGYEEFSFIGPEAVPEPSAIVLVGFAILLLVVARSFLTPRNENNAA
jgi:hypothetical protein